MSRSPRRHLIGYLLVLSTSFLTAVGAGWTTLASRMDRDAYDWMSRAHPPAVRTPDSVVLAIDEPALASTGGMRNIRSTLASLLERIIPAQPAVVAIDVILADAADAAENKRLAQVFVRTPNLILASDLVPGTGVWEDPLPAFATAAKAIGHIHAAPDPVSRVLPLELAAGHERRWAMALEAARLRLGAEITETPETLELGTVVIPARRRDSRPLFIRYRENFPVVSAQALLSHAISEAVFKGKVVFVGVTAQTAARDRLVTPLDRPMTGVEIHAQAYESIVGGDFLSPAPLSLVVLICFTLTTASGMVFALLAGWRAWAAAAAVIICAHLTPHTAFTAGIVVPYLATVWAAWLSVVCAAAWQYFFVRGQLQRSESDRARYQEAIQFVTHEMRSPLTAIQGSSELMERYNLTEEKRRQMAQMINSESKRLAHMIQTFLDVERLTDGRAEIRSEPFDLNQVLDSCMARAQVLADRKQIRLDPGELAASTLTGDRELMEYAVYNLLTNAVKYSPAGTTVRITAQRTGSTVRLAVRDQGIGMDEKELSNIGRKFYRTKKAEASGEAGTGIGLSLVQQIVAYHHGRMEVSSTPGAGSCFTMVLPAQP